MDIRKLGVVLGDPNPHKPNALELALVAATVDPALAKTDPVKAVEIARQLISVAQADIDRPYHEESKELHSDYEFEREFERLFPENERVSVAEAFERWPSGYTSENRFEAALVKAGLSFPVPEKYSNKPGMRGVPIAWKEFTSERAVHELDEWKRKHARQLNRESKKRASTKKFEKIRGNWNPQKRNLQTKKKKRNNKSGKGNA
jgi:hypothetical protein